MNEKYYNILVPFSLINKLNKNINNYEIIIDDMIKYIEKDYNYDEVNKYKILIYYLNISVYLNKYKFNYILMNNKYKIYNIYEYIIKLYIHDILKKDYVLYINYFSDLLNLLYIDIEWFNNYFLNNILKYYYYLNNENFIENIYMLLIKYKLQNYKIKYLYYYNIEYENMFNKEYFPIDDNQDEIIIYILNNKLTYKELLFNTLYSNKYILLRNKI